MITLELTLVRMIETKEQVAVYDKTDCLISLGRKVDAIVDPAVCEYCDVELTTGISMQFKSSFSEWPPEEEECAIIDNCSLGYGFASAIYEAFLSDENDWCEFVNELDYLSTETDIADRFQKEEALF